MVCDQSSRREGVGIGNAMAERRALKRLRLRSPLQLMNEERDLVIRTRRARVAHDQRAEEATVHVRLDIAHVVMEWPRSDRVLRRVEHVRPALARPNLVASAPRPRTYPERPSPVRFDAIAQAVQMEAVAVGWVAVQDMNVQTLAWARKEHAARHSPIPRWFIDIGGHEL